MNNENNVYFKSDQLRSVITYAKRHFVLSIPYTTETMYGENKLVINDHRH